jgi:23S rRNA pseudouridine1911/1915/1917 synthase
VNEIISGQTSYIYHDQEAKRLDLFLVDCLPEYSRSRIQKFIKGGHVSVDQQICRKTGYLLDNNSMVSVKIPKPEPSKLVPEDIPLNIIYEDSNLLVINKPAGMVVHPSAGHLTGTLVHAVLAHAPEMEGVGGIQRPGVVHRLDKNTSGIILLAKNDQAHRWLQDQFRNRKVEKKYLALVDGHPPTPTGRIEAPISRDIRDRKKMAIVQENKGRQAISEYRTIQKFEKHSLIEVHLITGRTHQIRLHMAFIHCPVVGDTIYGKRHSSILLKRHFLHAGHLRICLYKEDTAHTFSVSLPEELEKILDSLPPLSNQ